MKVVGVLNRPYGFQREAFFASFMICSVPTFCLVKAAKLLKIIQNVDFSLRKCNLEPLDL